MSIADYLELHFLPHITMSIILILFIYSILGTEKVDLPYIKLDGVEQSRIWFALAFMLIISILLFAPFLEPERQVDQSFLKSLDSLSPNIANKDSQLATSQNNLHETKESNNLSVKIKEQSFHNTYHPLPNSITQGYISNNPRLALTSGTSSDVTLSFSYYLSAIPQGDDLVKVDSSGPLVIFRDSIECSVVYFPNLRKLLASSINDRSTINQIIDDHFLDYFRKNGYELLNITYEKCNL